MTQRNPFSGESGQANRVALAAVAIAMTVIVMTGAAAIRTSVAVTPEAAATPAATDSEPFVYFPAQYVNQATEIEPAPPTF